MEHKKLAVQANDHMVAAKTFLDVYCKLQPEAITTLTSDMEVRCVMYVHSINADTRISLKSLLHILGAMYDAAKLADPALLKWNKLQSLKDHATNQAVACTRYTSLCAFVAFFGLTHHHAMNH